MTRRRVLLVAGLSVPVALLATPAAHAVSDVYANVGPGMSVSALADRYPLGNYALDQHFDAVKASLTGGVDASGIPPMIAFFLANLVWQITAFVANALITLFAFAFSLDLVNGSQATGGTGALAPVSTAIGGLYAHTFGQPWMAIAITGAGCWAMWRALIQRRYTETAGTLGLSLIFCLIAMAVVVRPDATIGTASRWTNQLSAAFLSVTAHGEVATGDSARRAAGDQLFSLLVLRPWVALNFGGTEHCIRTASGSEDHDPVSVAVRPLPAPAEHALQTTGQVSTAAKQCVANTVRYPAHFLAFPPGSEDRDGEYDALNDADPNQLPDSDPTKATGTYRPGIVDKPVTDAMEKAGQYQRLLLALLVLIGELGAWLLLGALALSVVLSQVMVLLLACFSPVALVAGIVPGRGHDLFRVWASQLTTFLVRKAAYSLVLAVVLSVLTALQDAASDLGWLMSFGLQTALTWTVFLQRHRLAGQVGAAISGQHPEREAQLRRLLGLGYASRLIKPARRRSAPTSPPRSNGADAGRPQHAHAAWADATGVPTSRTEEPGAPLGPDRERPQNPPRSVVSSPGEDERPADAALPAAVAAAHGREAHRRARHVRTQRITGNPQSPTRHTSGDRVAVSGARGASRPATAHRHTERPAPPGPAPRDGRSSPPPDPEADAAAARSPRPPHVDDARASLAAQLRGDHQRLTESGRPAEPLSPARPPDAPESVADEGPRRGRDRASRHARRA